MASTDNHCVKKSMTDQERLALANKLDKDLDAWIDGLEKKSYADGWPQDRWEQEMEKHPFFMTKFPENSDETSPLLEGIQQLKYDENANTPLELAQSYKEDGNFNFKHRKYRMAVISYTEGIRRKCGDPETEATLYNNRAAAQFFLENFRSSLMDCKQCLKIKPSHDKAEVRAIKCCLKLQKPKEALEFCQSYLNRNSSSQEVLELREEAIRQLKSIERDCRKEARQKEKLEADINGLLKAILSRRVRMEVNGDPKQFLLEMHERPELLSDGSLTWPVFFLYPEYSQSDFVEKFHENTTVIAMLVEVMSTLPDWDLEKKYHPDFLNVYYEGSDRSQLFRVNPTSSLATVITLKGFVVRNYHPTFFVLRKDTIAERNFLKNYSLIKS